MKSKDIKLDVHTHTIVSGHAFNTMQEMILAAQAKELQVFGITEHGPSIPGTCAPIYFRNIHVVPRQWHYIKADGTSAVMRLLMGAEINILDCNGTLDIDDFIMNRLDLRIAGVHPQCFNGGTKDEETAGMINAIKNPWTHIISHPGDGNVKLHYEPVVLAAKESKTLLEINNASFKPVRGLNQSRDNNLEILRLCKRYDTPVILGSDAHITFDIANYEYLYPLLQETEFPDELIMNDKPEEFMKMLNIK